MSHEDERQALLDEIATLKAQAGEDGEALAFYGDRRNHNDRVSDAMHLDHYGSRARARLNARQTDSGERG